MVHHLKTWPEYFGLLKSGEKNFELRKNDRDFKAGDELVLEEFDPKSSNYTGQTLRMKITYVLEGTLAENFGLQPGYCILALKNYFVG
jgi:ASC-1-like (ASCH) protein